MTENVFLVWFISPEMSDGKNSWLHNDELELSLNKLMLFGELLADYLHLYRQKKNADTLLSHAIVTVIYI